MSKSLCFEEKITLPKLKKRASLYLLFPYVFRLIFHNASLQEFSSFIKPPLIFFSDGSLNPQYFTGFMKEYNLNKQDDYLAPTDFPKHSEKNFILFGNGPSLSLFKFNQIRPDVITIGMNYSNQFFSSKYHIFSSLASFLIQSQQINLKQTKLLVAGWLWNYSTKSFLFNKIYDHVIPFSSQSVKLVPSSNIGEIAIDIAVKMGAKNILLVGYDGYGKGKTLLTSNQYFEKKRYIYSNSYGGLSAFRKLIHQRDPALAMRIRYRQDYYSDQGVKIIAYSSLSYHNLSKASSFELKNFLDDPN